MDYACVEQPPSSSDTNKRTEMKFELLQEAVFSLSPISLPTKTNTNEHSSEKYNRTFILHNTTSQCPGYNPKVFTKMKNQERVSHSQEKPQPEINLKMNEMLELAALKSSASIIILKDVKEKILLMNAHIENLTRETETIRQS